MRKVWSNRLFANECVSEPATKGISNIGEHTWPSVVAGINHIAVFNHAAGFHHTGAALRVGQAKRRMR